MYCVILNVNFLQIYQTLAYKHLQRSLMTIAQCEKRLQSQRQRQIPTEQILEEQMKMTLL